MGRIPTPTRCQRRLLRRSVIALSVLAVLGLGLTACLPPAEPGAPILMKGTWAGGLSKPWDLAFLPTGVGLFTENDLGLISARMSDTETRRVLGDVHTFDAGFDPSGEGGLMGIAVDPNWTVNQRAYVCYSAAGSSGTGVNRVASFTVNPDVSPAVANWHVIIDDIPHNTFHDGCRVRFAPGTDQLFVSTGDAGQATAPQDDSSLGGKILRVQVTTNGTKAIAYPGNTSGQLWYTKGHRNPQGIAFRPGTSQVFDDEHGPDVNDEVNLLTPGGNAGWNPNNGAGGYDQSQPMTGPTATIIPTWQSGGVTVAPSGSTFLSGSKWRNWDGALVVACLDGSPDVGQRLLVMHLDAAGTALTAAPVTALAQGVRLRAAVQGPDGDLYVVTDQDGGSGQISRIAPL
jgi:glucose/arabinose dehydrogenase